MKKKRKKRHCVIKAIFRLLIVLVCLVLGVGAFFGVKGYEMYQDAIAERTLDERVEDIRNTENFTIYSELPQFYIDATISVEDHRFADHCGIDLIAIGRAGDTFAARFAGEWAAMSTVKTPTTTPSTIPIILT